MELLTNYNEDTLQLISDDASTYSLPNLDGDINYTFKLSVFSNINIFLGEFILEQNKDFYVKNNQLTSFLVIIQISYIYYICRILYYFFDEIFY